MLAGFVVSFFSQVWLLSCLSSSLCKNSNEFYAGFVYSSLMVFWTPTCRAEHFCNNGFFAINDAAEWEREDLQRRWTFLPNQFFFLFIFHFKVGHFFSPVVLEICITTGRIFYFTTKRKITSIHYKMKRKKERNTSDDRNFFSFVIHE